MTENEYDVIIANYKKDLETLEKQIKRKFMKIHSTPQMPNIERLEIYREISVLQEMKRDVKSAIGAMDLYFKKEKEEKHYQKHYGKILY